MAKPLNNDPLRDFAHQAVIVDTILTETTVNKLGDYIVREPGSAFDKGSHNKQQLNDLDGNEFLAQKASNDEAIVQQYWGTPPRTQDIYNWEISYANESAAAPSFQRRYLVKRDEYTANPPYLMPFAGLYRITVTSGGSGYTKPPTISFSGGTGSGATAIALIDNQGRVSKITLKTQGTYTVAPTVVITPAAGDITGAGATATAIIQLQTCLLTKEIATNNAPFPYDSLYIVVTRQFDTMPGPILTTHVRDEDIRGQIVTLTTQRGANGTLSPETGNGIIASQTKDLTTQVEERTTKKVSSFPDSESWAFWGYVSLPTLVFDIIHSIYCNNSKFFTLVTNYETGGGGAFFRKHRVTVSYHSSYPNPDLSASTFEATDIRYQGKVIAFSFSNVLNDALSYDGDFYNSDSETACFWTEAYSYSATDPSASEFAAGIWITKDYQVSPWGVSGFKATRIEYYSAPGNPSI